MKGLQYFVQLMKEQVDDGGDYKNIFCYVDNIFIVNLYLKITCKHECQLVISLVEFAPNPNPDLEV